MENYLNQAKSYWHSLLALDSLSGKVVNWLVKYNQTLILLLVLLIMLNSLAALTWKFFPAHVASPMRLYPGKQAVQKTSAQAKSHTLLSVADLHLFGEVKQKAVVTEKVIDAPDTRLRLTLKGVFASTNKSLAMAIIANEKGDDKTYRIGDKIAGQAELHAVFADRVILKQNGRLEALRLPKASLGQGAIAEEMPLVSESSAYNEKVSKQLKNIRETLVKDPSKIWQQVRINPHMSDGVINGYTLDHNDPDLMKALNLRKTDVIKSINGMALSDPSTLYSLMGELSKQSIIDLLVERDGQEQMIQITF